MNAYKEAWLAEAMFDYSQKRTIAEKTRKVQARRGKISSKDIASIAAKQKAQGIIVKGARDAAKYAARSQMKGTVGIALRVGGRIGLRVVPGIGAAMLAYDLYKLGQYVLD